MLTRFQEQRTWSPAQLIEEFPETATATVYRNLETFLNKGIIAVVHTHDGVPHYEMAERGHHDHLLCQNCSVSECVSCVAPNIPDHILELRGLCTSCT